MKNKLASKSIVFMTIVLFIGAGILPSTIGTIKEKTVSTGFGSRGYIQGLIDNASDGDTIYIPSGIYYENIIINKSISLIGEDKYTTVIDGGNAGTVVSIVSDWVNVSEFTIKNSSGSGISISCNSSTITYNAIIHGGAGCPGCWVLGITLSGNDTIISDNIIMNNSACLASGMTLSGNNNIISNNTITNNYGYNYEAGIILSGDNNTIYGNNITDNHNYGISLVGENNTIYGNNITNNHNCGISLRGDNNTIFGNTLINNNDNVDLYGNNNTISDNVFTDNNGSSYNGRGISLNGDNNTIFNNNISNTDYGMTLRSSSNNIISNNSFFNNGLFIYDIYNNSVMNNTVNEKPLIYVYNKSDLIIDGDVDLGQLILVNCINITIENQELFNTTVGIQILGANTCFILDNTLANNIWGISLAGNNNTISGNTIMNNKYGIELDKFSGRNIITGNTITNNNNYGIRCSEFSGNNTITGNTITNNYYDGISLGFSSGNNITGNTISDNFCGIDSSYINNNTYYHNNFINNTINAQVYGNNIWDDDYPSGGNYWDDYTGVDFNGDGIGDTPYDIPGESEQDRYPFIEPDGWLIEPDFKKVFIFGMLTNISSIGGYITFEAVKTRVIIFKPFSFHKYLSGETWIISEDYLGFIGKQYVFALCEIIVRI